MPVHGRLEIAFVDRVDEDLRALLHLHRGAWNRSVVGEHTDGRSSDLLRDRRDSQLEFITIRELDDLALATLENADGLSGKFISHDSMLLRWQGLSESARSRRLALRC